MEIVCPKCRSSYIDIANNEGLFEYRCKNNKEFGKKLCIWQEDQSNKFLSYFIDENIEINEIKNSYSVLYLFAESLKITNIPSLYKNNELISEIEKHKKIDLLYEEFKNKFHKLRLPDRSSLISKKIVEDDKQKYDLIILHDNFFEKFRLNGDINFFKGFKFLANYVNQRLKNSGSLIIFSKEKFIDNEYISNPDNILHSFYEYKNKNKEMKIIFKRLIVIPNSKEFVKNDLDIFLSNTYCLYFIKYKKSFYFNKISVVEKHFWKKYEFGQRKTPYNVYGKDPGSYWIRTRLDKQKVKGLSEKQIKKYVAESGQEKYKFIPLTNYEAYGRLILLLTPANANILEILPNNNKPFLNLINHLYRNYYYLDKL